MKYLPSELIINADGSCFHLHLRPEQLADRVILVGDPGRVNLVASHFDSIECEVTNREFHTVTGIFQGKRITCLSTGIGCDNIDIVVNELDALANIDFIKRDDNPTFRQLTIIRIGTCGAIQADEPIGSFIASVKSIGFDGLLNYYADRNRVCDLQLEEAFKKHMQWSPLKGSPYVANADSQLVNQIAGTEMLRGITIACGGFYGPQGRQIRLSIQDPEQNAKIESFRYHPQEHSFGDDAKSTSSNVGSSSELRILNFEMESSALAGLASMLGHRAMTCCVALANRYQKQMNVDAIAKIDELIRMVLERI